MTRIEQIFATVTDNGTSSAEAAAAVGIAGNKASEMLGKLARDGRIYRGRNGYETGRFFLTAEAAEKYSEDSREARIIAGVTDKGWTGYTLHQAVGMDKSTVRKALQRLAAAGKIHAGTVGNLTKYFRTKAAAEDFEANWKPAPAMPTVEIKTTVKRFIEGAQIVIPPHVQKQECPPFRGLGFREPEPVIGGFRTMGPGRYLESDEAMLRRISRKGA